nr:hypothetical protein GCM10025732_11990 [Glycomyces mayteni]
MGHRLQDRRRDRPRRRRPRGLPERIKAALQYTLSQASDGGHCFLPAPNLVADTVELLAQPSGPVAAALAELAAAGSG